MKNGKWEAAIVGCGGISAVHADALVRSEKAEIAAFCDIRPERAEARRSAYAPDARIYTDFEEMLVREPSLDVIHLCVPHYLHTPMAISALAAGKHVLLEKPVGISEEDIAALSQAEKTAKGKLCVCFQNRFNDATRLLDACAARYGVPKGGRAFVTWHRDEEYYLSSGWRGSYATEGGGVMINQAIHTLDLLLRYLGTPVSLSATTANHHLSGVIEVEDSCELTARFASGAVGCFYATTSYAVDSPVFLEIDYEGHRVSLTGGRVYDNGEPLSEAPEAHIAPGKNCWGDGHIRLIEAFYDALDTSAPTPVPLDSASLSLRVLLAAYRSGGKEVPV